MRKALLLSGLIALTGGCVRHKPSWTGEVQWPDERSSASVLPFTEAGAAVAAAGALREVIRTNPHPQLFHGCTSPEQGLDIAVFTGPTTGLYYVAVEQRFSRCGGPNGRVLDWWQVYAVTPQGEVVAKAPRTPDVPMEVQPDAAEAPADSPAPPTEEQVPSPLRGAPPAENTKAE
ncbi:hypothetical protein COCOR_07270 [Corallococcus coralloides DSM 2259]|uniref:Lipoprotein n=1 Tax=Corallococcus coralloides (strain ATCC 25202 / DSM 2259 / NBRC 100086 / M2) TaxID=1144275 RepID=H8MJY6_CORCM|nr:hypothetical protein [Corallococcus coralloides]AFE07436.1 hypothetical protein COCOR_07270 [Corallococcus coralloides DSM 2259]